MVAAILIIPYIQRLNKGKSDQQKNNRPAQVTEQVDSAATTTANTTQNTTQVTTSSTEGISVFHKTARMLQVFQAKTLPTNSTSNTTSKSIVAKNTTTETSSNAPTTTKTTQAPITQITTTTSYATTTKKTTTTSTGVNNAPVETEGYYPSPEEWDMFCVVVCSETGYCEDKAQLAVAHTVINRLSNPIYPNTIKEILTQRAQYTCVSNYYTGNMRPGLEIGGEAYNHTMQLVHQAWEEWDFTNGAVAYYNPHMIGWNAWFEQYECVYEDQYGRFFKV